MGIITANTLIITGTAVLPAVPVHSLATAAVGKNCHGPRPAGSCGAGLKKKKNLPKPTSDFLDFRTSDNMTDMEVDVICF